MGGGAGAVGRVHQGQLVAVPEDVVEKRRAAHGVPLPLLDEELELAPEAVLTAAPATVGTLVDIAIGHRPLIQDACDATPERDGVLLSAERSPVGKMVVGLRPLVLGAVVRVDSCAVEGLRSVPFIFPCICVDDDKAVHVGIPFAGQSDAHRHDRCPGARKDEDEEPRTAHTGPVARP